jgi:hypothetical protein
MPVSDGRSINLAGQREMGITKAGFIEWSRQLSPAKPKGPLASRQVPFYFYFLNCDDNVTHGSLTPEAAFTPEQGGRS